MFGFLTTLSLRAWLRIATGLAFALLLAWALRIDNRREHWHGIAKAYAKQAGTIILALEEATGQSQKWETAPGQIRALGYMNASLKDGIVAQNAKIDELAREAVKAEAKAAELKRIADKAEAQRRAALKGLSDMAATPGHREDCMMLLQEAEAALDLVRDAGG